LRSALRASKSPLVIFFSLQSMDDPRRLALVSLVAILDLEVHSPIPDIDAIERFPAARYCYWEDDIPHKDLFGPLSRP
jgi:hypothetical protein